MFDLETWHSMQNKNPYGVRTEETYDEFKKYKKLYQVLKENDGEIPEDYFKSEGEED